MGLVTLRLDHYSKMSSSSDGLFVDAALVDAQTPVAWARMQEFDSDLSDLLSDWMLVKEPRDRRTTKSCLGHAFLAGIQRALTEEALAGGVEVREDASIAETCIVALNAHGTGEESRE